MRRAAAIAGLLLAGCSVRAPAPVDVAAMTRAAGTPDAARRALVARVLADPRDVQARAALAELAEQTGRPGEALAELEAILALGGPLGPRWRPSDRARLARLVWARGQARAARGAASGLADLRWAAELGAPVGERELVAARVAAALAQARHVDGGVRAQGRRALAQLAHESAQADEWRGAASGATLDERAAFGERLWQAGARRAAFAELAAWHDGTALAERVGAAQQAYLIALAWWSPLWTGEAPPPPAADLTGPAACRFPGVPCIGRAAAADAPIGARATAPADVVFWVSTILARDDASWGAAIRARVDGAAALRDPNLPDDVGTIVARLSGLAPPPPHAGAPAAPAAVSAVARQLGAGEPDPGSTTAPAGDLRASAIARHVARRVPNALPDAERVIGEIAAAFRQDPAIAERRARDAVAMAVDPAAASAAVGATFDALGDPARARAAWQAAVDGSPEPAFQLGLAAACARAQDPDAALIVATAGAAASGDPAVAWVVVARALSDVGAWTHALTAARSALGLAGPDALPGALEVAIVASRALGRTEQAAGLAAQRAALAPAWEDPESPRAAPDDPTDVDRARLAVQHAPTAVALAELWVATRWAPRDTLGRAALAHALPADDPRAPVIQRELWALAADADPVRALPAIQALR